MEIVLVHWLIKKGSEKPFEAAWHKMTVGSEKGLYREILTTIDDAVQDPKFHTFSLGNPQYTTYINIGIWESVKHFDDAIAKYIPEPKVEEVQGENVVTMRWKAYEFKLRERLVLKKVNDRGGQLPPADFSE